MLEIASCCERQRSSQGGQSREIEEFTASNRATKRKQGEHESNDRASGHEPKRISGNANLSKQSERREL
jgi:hypothetical protein